jgi:hypothetical protein
MRIRPRTFAIGAAVALAVLGALAAVLVVELHPQTAMLTGVVLRQDSDPRKQTPVGNVQITAVEGGEHATAETSASGLFRLDLSEQRWRDRPVTLTFRRPDYQPAQISAALNSELYVVRLKPTPAPPATPAQTGPIAIRDVRVRYAERTSTNVDVGSAAKTFTIENAGNVPCHDQSPCSPDGKWKAAEGGVTMDAGAGQQFKNVRVSCIAGPCPFTKIESGAGSNPGRSLTVKVLVWSDTVTFLVEAEVTRAMPSDAIRQAYPAIFGRSMSFTLPATAEGPSLETDFGGMDIVFPLGPALELSWADCSLRVEPDKSQLYLCTLKPGYEFKP